MYERYMKRIFDIVLSGIAIVVLAIPMVIIAVAIKIDDPGPVLFKQKRVGIKKNGKIKNNATLKKILALSIYDKKAKKEVVIEEKAPWD